jgi:hypothetical protein
MLDTAWLYAAYLYGAMQGGSELSWKLSGPIFAKDKHSTPFSSLNLVLVGARGCTYGFALKTKTDIPHKFNTV